MVLDVDSHTPVRVTRSAQENKKPTLGWFFYV